MVYLKNVGKFLFFVMLGTLKANHFTKRVFREEQPYEQKFYFSELLHGLFPKDLDQKFLCLIQILNKFSEHLYSKNTSYRLL